MTMIREKNQNDSAIVNITPSSPIEVTGVLGKEYEISVTRAKDLESGEDNQEFQISTVILIGSECLFVGGISVITVSHNIFNDVYQFCELSTLMNVHRYLRMFLYAHNNGIVYHDLYAVIL